MVIRLFKKPLPIVEPECLTLTSQNLDTLEESQV